MAESENSNNHWLSSLITSILGDGKLFFRAIILVVILGVGYLIYLNLSRINNNQSSEIKVPEQDSGKSEKKECTIKITGTLCDEKGKPIRGKTFQVKKLFRRDKGTDSEGYFTFEDVRLDEDPRYKTIVFEISLNGEQLSKNIELKNYKPKIENGVFFYDLEEIILNSTEKSLNSTTKPTEDTNPILEKLTQEKNHTKIIDPYKPSNDEENIKPIEDETSPKIHTALYLDFIDKKRNSGPILANADFLIIEDTLYDKEKWYYIKYKNTSKDSDSGWVRDDLIKKLNNYSSAIKKYEKNLNP
jgi:hypothetical protein